MAKKKLNTEEEVSAPLRVRLFGQLELENPWGRVVENPARQSLSWLLLKYLLVNPDRGVTSEELWEEVWTDRETERAGADRVRLHRLRKALEPLHLDGQNGLVLFHTANYQINPECDITFDTDELFEILTRLRAVPADEPDGLELCRQGLELFRGRFWQIPVLPLGWIGCGRFIANGSGNWRKLHSSAWRHRERESYPCCCAGEPHLSPRRTGSFAERWRDTCSEKKRKAPWSALSVQYL